MEKEYLIKKWLDYSLTDSELEAFKQLEDYEELVKLSDSMQKFKASEFDTDMELNSVLKTLENKKQQKNNWLKPFMRIAAVLAIGFSVYFYTTSLDTSVYTLASQKTTIELPDTSEVTLNAVSNITYNKKNWTKERLISLEGEAYFKVSKGSKFTVNTLAGDVTVLGTQFNVKQRDNYFEVTCFEGSVRVDYNGQSKVLKPQDQLIINGSDVRFNLESKWSESSWLSNKSTFKSVRYEDVLKEFERQYDVKIDTKNINLEERFSGTFENDNKILALKSICLPLRLKYNIINDSSIVLSRE